MKSAGVITILTVDDHPIIRDAIAGAVKDEADMSIVGEAQNGADAIEALRRHRPDITLLDLRMPLMNGTEALKTILGEFPSARIIILTTYEGDVHAARALRAGARVICSRVCSGAICSKPFGRFTRASDASRLKSRREWLSISIRTLFRTAKLRCSGW